MENVEKSIARIMADKVYTSSEFKRERDTFNSLCKDLERAEVKKWLAQILEILMAERAKDQRNTEMGKLDTLIKKHEELIPNVQKTAVMVDLYWKCYAYGDELSPMLSSLTASCCPPPGTSLPPAWRMWMSRLRDRRSLFPSLTPRETLSQISLPRVRSSCRTLTSPSSLRPMSSVSRMDGKIPNRRLRTDFSFLMRPRVHSLVMLRTARLLPMNLTLLRKKLRKLRRFSILMPPMPI